MKHNFLAVSHTRSSFFFQIILADPEINVETFHWNRNEPKNKNNPIERETSRISALGNIAKNFRIQLSYAYTTGFQLKIVNVENGKMRLVVSKAFPKVSQCSAFRVFVFHRNSPRYWVARIQGCEGIDREQWMSFYMWICCDVSIHPTHLLGKICCYEGYFRVVGMKNVRNSQGFQTNYGYLMGMSFGLNFFTLEDELDFPLYML